MFERFKRWMPTPEQLAGNRWLRWLGPALHHPRLWHLSRRGVALGVAIGIFFAFLVPIAQIPLAAAVSVALRANVPTAVASTLVTNPITFPPIYFAAWKVGSWVLGEDPSAEAPPLPTAEARADGQAPGGWWAQTWRQISGVGKPLVVGLLCFGIGGGLLVYGLIHVVWGLRVRIKRRQRLREAPRRVS
jgi:uncharacterized protein